MSIKTSVRGYAAADFDDHYGAKCIVQDSSPIGEPTLWLGMVKDPEGRDQIPMHLNRAMVADLLQLLTRFVETGSIKSPH